MRKKTIADNVIKLLKQGYSPKEITKRMAVSYNYAWKLKKDLEAAAKDVIKEVKTTILSVDKNVFPEADTNVDAILNERATTYGSFAGQASVAQRLKAVAHQFAGQNNKTFAPDQAEALDMIFSKVGRILNGDPNHIDSWVDIAGYVTLVADRLNGKIR